MEQEVIQIAEKEGLIWDIEKADTDMLYRGFASVIFGKDHNKDPDHKEKLFIFVTHKQSLVKYSSKTIKL